MKKFKQSLAERIASWIFLSAALCGMLAASWFMWMIFYRGTETVWIPTLIITGVYAISVVSANWIMKNDELFK